MGTPEILEKRSGRVVSSEVAGIKFSFQFCSIVRGFLRHRVVYRTRERDTEEEFSLVRARSQCRYCGLHPRMLYASPLMSLPMKKNREDLARKHAPTPEERLLAALEEHLEPMSDEEIEARVEAVKKTLATKYGDGEANTLRSKP